MRNPIYINELRKKIMFELKDFEPKYFKVYEDPRIDMYYIFINLHVYMALEGLYNECDSLVICKNDKALTFEQLENCENGNGTEKIGFDAGENIIFEMKLNEYTGNVDELTVLLTNIVREAILS